MKLFNNKTIEEVSSSNTESTHLHDLLILQKYNNNKSDAMEALAGTAMESLGVPPEVNLDEFLRSDLVLETLNPPIRIVHPAETLIALEILTKQKDIITGNVSGWISTTQASLEHLCSIVRYPKELLGYPLNSQRNDNQLVIEEFTNKVWVELQDWWVGKDNGYQTGLEARLESLDSVNLIYNKLTRLRQKALSVDSLRDVTIYHRKRKSLAEDCALEGIFPLLDPPQAILSNIKDIITTDHTKSINDLIHKVDEDRLTSEQFEEHLTHHYSKAFGLVDGKNDKFYALAVESLPSALGACVRSGYTDIDEVEEISTNKTIIDALEMHAVCYNQLDNVQNSSLALINGVSKVIMGDLTVNRVKLVISLLDQRESHEMVQENLLEYVETTGKVLSLVENGALVQRGMDYNKKQSEMSLKEIAMEVNDTESLVDFLSVLTLDKGLTPAILELSTEAFNIAVTGNKDYFEETLVLETKTTKDGVFTRIGNAVKKFVDRIVAAVKRAYKWLAEKVMGMWRWMTGTKPHVDATEVKPKQAKDSDFDMKQGDPVEGDGDPKPEEDNSNFDNPDDGTASANDEPPVVKKAEYKTNSDTSPKRKKGRNGKNNTKGGQKRGKKTKMKKQAGQNGIKVSHPQCKDKSPHIINAALSDINQMQGYLYGYYGKKLLHLYNDISANYKVLDKLRKEVGGIIKSYKNGDPEPTLKTSYEPLHKALTKKGLDRNAPLASILNRTSVNVGFTYGKLTPDAADAILRTKFKTVTYVTEIVVLTKKLEKEKDLFSKILQQNTDKACIKVPAIANAILDVTTGATGVIAAMAKVQAMESARVRSITKNNALIGRVQRGDYSE